MNFELYLLRQRLMAIIARVSDIALFIGIVLIGGIGTHWYMVDAGSVLSVERIGPWVSWGQATRRNSDPYARAHFARLGALPLSSEISRTYVAHTDNSGHTLYSSCDYTIEGQAFRAGWWSISVFDNDGALIENPAGRYSFTRDTMAIAPDGRFVVSVARDARSGNWLPTGGAGRLAVMLVLQDDRSSIADDALTHEGETLPSITQVKCR
ncbi:MAG: DUF1214 domain-containing protein [Hyphomicrobiaceae bacterium]|nr:DUF1214 domain-containing protein [Hyphomicrobiaceae bacterium]